MGREPKKTLVLAHKGTVDKAGQPYILHPLRLLLRVETETEKIVAVLHDVVEDSQPPQRWGFDELRREAFPSPCWRRWSV